MKGIGARAFALALILSAGVAVIPACNIAPDPDQLALELLPIPDNPEVAVRVLLKVGAAEDPTGKDGLCCLTWRLLSEGGSRLRSLEDLAGAFDLDAAGFALRLEKEVAVFSAVVRKDDLAAFYPVFRDMLLDPGFRADDLIDLNPINCILSGPPWPAIWMNNSARKSSISTCTETTPTDEPTRGRSKPSRA